MAFNIWLRIYLFLKNYITTEGAVSHNVLYHRAMANYQQLSTACYQVGFYANILFWLPIVSSAFNQDHEFHYIW